MFAGCRWKYSADAKPQRPADAVAATRAAQGERGALDRVFAALYPELRRIAHARLRSQGDVTHLDTTTLVHESFLRLVDAAQLMLADRKHFFTYAAKTMRNIIIDFAREQLCASAAAAARCAVTLDTELAGSCSAPPRAKRR